MKKTLIAAAVLAASGAAMAQSNVTLYGVVDAWVGSTKTGLNAPSVSQVGSGGLMASRFGFTGEEDLGGGLKAIFKLEQGFNSDDGTQEIGNEAFSRLAYVGVSGGFGEVTIGKNWTAFDDVAYQANTAFDSAFSAQRNVHLVWATYADHPNNTIKYVSPEFSGATFAFSHSLDENAATSANITDFAVMYSTGPIGVNFAYQLQDDAISANEIKLTALNGSYDFGVAKLIAGYGQLKEGTEKTTEYQIGVDVPLTDVLAISGGYAWSKDKDAGIKTGERSGFGIAMTYALSKRTTLYTGLRSDKVENAAGTKTDETRLLAVGVNHKF